MLSALLSVKSKAYGFIFSRTFIGEVLTGLHSMWLHLRYSFNDRNPDTEQERLEYYLVKHCHIIEKGLALPSPRKGFGQPKIADLIKRTQEYEQQNPDSLVGEMVRDTLREYLAFHANDLQILPMELLRSMTLFVGNNPSKLKGGLKVLNKPEMMTYGGESFEKFLSCRHSVRNFSDTPVEDDAIRRALKISQHTPSVCNRQGWKVHYYNDRNKIRQLLSFQNGNSGFTEQVDKLLIVTGSTKAFTRYEHNQLFIDGGLYAMNLMLALHSLGLGSCPLNTCMSWLKAGSLKQTAGIPRHEQLIMMIAVGNLLDEFRVAKSHKYPVDKILKLH